MDQPTITGFFIPPADDPLSGWRDGDAWLAGGTLVFYPPMPHLRRLRDLSNMGWPSITVRDHELERAATCGITEHPQSAEPCADPAQSGGGGGGRGHHLTQVDEVGLNAGELVSSAILDESIVDCARIPGMREVMIAAGNEAVEVAHLEELVANHVLTHSRSTILQDWIKGRHTEVNEINGLVVSGRARHRRTAPVNQAAVEFALGIEAGVRERGRHNIEPMLARLREHSEA